MGHSSINACSVTLRLVGVMIALAMFSPAARAANTITVCPSGCTATSISAGVAAASAGDTVDVKASGSPYTERVLVTKPITLQGDPAGPSPTLQYPGGFLETTLTVTNAASGSTLRHMIVLSNGAGIDPAISFAADNGTISDVSATATGTTVLITGTGVIVGPSVSLTTAASAQTALEMTGPSATVTGVTATATGTVGVAAAISGGGTITDSTFTATNSHGAGLALGGGGSATVVHRVSALGDDRGIQVNGGATVTDSVATASSATGVAVDDLVGGNQNSLELRNVTAIATGTSGIGVRAGAGAGQPATVHAKNVIARGPLADVQAEQSAAFCSPNCTPGTLTVGFSNFRSAPGADTGSLGNNQSADPKFANAAAGDFHLQPGSPAIGAGTADSPTTNTDRDGVARPVLGQSAPSIGAYEPVLRALTVSFAGAGAGIVAGGGVVCTSSCVSPIARGAPVTLHAFSSPGSTFAGWSGGGCTGTVPCQVTLSADTAVTATFTLQTHTLAVTRAGSGSGSVTGSGITCPGTACSRSYPTGTPVTLTAHPASGSTFAGWTGACSGTGACAVTMSADHDVTANFQRSRAALRCRLAVASAAAPPVVTVRCTGDARFSLAGTLTERTRTARRTRTATITLRRITGNIRRGVGQRIPLTLPPGAQAALTHGARESIALTLTATSPGTSARAQLTIARVTR